MISHFRYFLSNIYDASKRGIKKKAGGCPSIPPVFQYFQYSFSVFWSPASL